MFSGDPGTARQEAERLVVAALAAATLAANANPNLATGSAACCVCPFCKIIEAVRDPDPEFVERLATGAGDLAVGIAGLLRNLSGGGAGGDDGEAGRRTGDVWRHATAASPATTPAAADAPPTPPVKKVAKKAIKKAAPAPATPAPDQPKTAVPKKAVRKAPPRPSE